MTDPTPIIHVVDDDASVLRALERLLRSAGHACATYDSAEAFLAHAPQDAPGCVIVDLRLPGADGLSLQARINQTRGGLPVVFLTGRGDIATGVRAMKGGAVDFLTKPVEPEALLAAVGSALERDRAARAAGAEGAAFEAAFTRLTPREREVLERVVAGQLNKQIAGELGIAEKTIKVHRARVMQKLGVRTLADLVRIVTRRRG